MKKVITYVFIAVFIVFVIGLIVVISVNEAQDGPNKIVPTEAAISAYKSGGGILTHKPDQDLSFDGTMRCYKIVYMPEYDEFQVTVKYNKNAYSDFDTDEERGFEFKMYDTESGKEMTDYTYERASGGRYAYYRLVFSGVKFSDGADLELVMFPAGHDLKFSVIKLHKSGQTFTDYKLSKEEIASLGE